MHHQSDCPGNRLSKNGRRPRLLLLLAAAATLAVLVVLAVPALAAEPTLTADPVAAHTITTAQASGTITTDSEANGGAETFWFFQYTEAGKGEWASGPQAFSRTVPAETTALPVEEELTGLKAQTAYEVRLAAFPVPGGETYSAPSAPFTTSPAPTAPTLVLDPASGVASMTANISGSVDPEGGNLNGPGEPVPISWALETNHEGEGFAPVASGTIEGAPAEESNPIAVEAPLSGLAPGNHYAFRLRAGYAGQEVTSGEGSFTTEAVAPTISGTTSTGITGTSATLVAQVNPGGAATTWHFDYGTDEGYGHSTPAETITTELNSADTVEAQIFALEPGVGYHFRLVASNSAAPGGVDGPDTTFTALEAPATGLPDGRVYELVSAAESNSGNVYVPVSTGRATFFYGESGTGTLLPFQAAANGEAIAYVGDPTVGGNGSSGKGLGNQFLAIRAPGGGWSQSTLSPRGEKPAYYQAFSPNLTLGIIQAGSPAPEEVDVAPLAPGAPGDGYRALYSRRLDEASYRALLTTEPPHRDAEEFDTPGVPTILETAGGVLTFAGASSDGHEFLFEANDALTDASGLTPAAVDPGPEANDLYLSEEGRLSLVNILPGGGTEAGASFGASAAGRPEGNFPDFGHDISEDGSRVYWTDLSNGGVVYMRENPTREQSVVEEGECTEEAKACTYAVSAGPARYWTATPDGRFAYYTEEGRLWRFDSRKDSRRALTGPGAGVEAVIGTNEEGEDGSYVYFTATEVLPGSGEDSQGRPAQPGQANIYVLHGGAAPRFVAGLSTKDVEEALGDGVDRNPRGSFGDAQPGLGNRTAAVSADGTGLVFMSDDQAVDGFTPRFEGNPLEEVYAYSYGTDRLVCASCDPGHEQTSEGSLSGHTAGELAGLNGVGALLPPSLSATYLRRWLSADGSRVFFDSFEPLLPSDTDGTADVYEWERDGTGTCNRSAGCLFLISAGKSKSGSWLIDADETGKNVFFITRSELVSGLESGNEVFSLYDARVGGVIPSLAAPCSSADCEARPSLPPTSSIAGSESFHGPANPPPVACRKGRVKKHGRCVKKQPAKKHHKKSNKQKGKKQRDKRTAGHKGGGGR